MRYIVLFICALVGSQPQPFGQNNLSSGKQDWLSRSHAIKQKGAAALTDEMNREKAGDCPSAKTTYDEEVCLAEEIKKSTANYRAYLDSLRGVDSMTDTEDAATGPTGKPVSAQERVKEFDDVERAWQVFQKAQCSLAYDQYKGGTIAPIIQSTCELRLMRDRMHQLESIYDLTH